jgi:hypothetical protein
MGKQCSGLHRVGLRANPVFILLCWREAAQVIDASIVAKLWYQLPLRSTFVAMPTILLPWWFQSWVAVVLLLTILSQQRKLSLIHLA